AAGVRPSSGAESYALSKASPIGAQRDGRVPAPGDGRTPVGANLLTSVPTIDPENRLMSRAHRRRLTAEQLRDAMLAISGQLKLESSGQTYPANRASDFGFVFIEPRRSVYAPVFRNALP